ncbi:MAG: ABC transporter permease [Qingshengfaniella sp.]
MTRLLAPRLETIVIVASAALFLCFWAVIGDPWIANLPSLLRDVSWLGIVTIGTAMVIISGEFDLSVGSVYAFVSMVFLLLLEAGLGPALALVLAMALACGIGALTGLLVVRFQLPSLLVTLGFLFLYRGLVEWVTGGFTLTIAEDIQGHWLLTLLGGKALGFHNAILICLLLVVVFSFVLVRCRFGNHLYAVGGDVTAAAATGVPVGAVRVRSFVIGAMLAGFAGIITAANLSSVSTTTATNMEFEAIAGTVIGGVLLLGGAGTVWGALLGVFTLLSLKHGLILMGVNIFAYQIVLGLALVGLVALRGVFPRLFATR